MQNIINHSADFLNQDDIDCDKQFSEDVTKYQTQVECIIAWLFGCEEEMQQRPDETALQAASDTQILDEYSRLEAFIGKIYDYSHTIMKCKEEGQEMRENIDILSEEDRDEVGIQMDAMLVCYEKLKILATDRLSNLQKILEERQQNKIDGFEEWLSKTDIKLASSNNNGPDYTAIQKQLKELDDLRSELKQKQDILKLISRFIICDKVDPNSFNIESSSCESLDERLKIIDCKWKGICRQVDERYFKLRKAKSIWEILMLEGPQLTDWLRKIEKSLFEMSEASRNLSEIPSDKAFITKLLARSDKIDLEIKSKQSFYTSLENRVRNEIENFGDPCSMLAIELEKKLEDMQDNWNTIMNRKRMIDHTLQTLSNPLHIKQINYNMIPLPEPITSTSNDDLRFNNLLARNNYTSSKIDNHQRNEIHRRHLSDSSSSVNEDKESSLQLNESLSDPRGFDNSLSSTTRSLLYGNNNGQEQSLYNTNNDSQDEISSVSMSASYALNSIQTHDINSEYFCSQPNTNVHQPDDITLPHRLRSVETDYQFNHLKVDAHNCRVEEWKHSLESFSTWLKQVETSLAVDSTLETIVEPNANTQNLSWSRLDMHRQLLLLNEIENQITNTCQDEFDCLILQGQQIIEDLLPEIDENDYETNLKEILKDIELRYATVKRCFNERKHELADKERWCRLMKTLGDLCDHLIDKMGQVLPETNIGVDLITLAQQQDQLMHEKVNLEDSANIQSCKQDANLFLKLCDTLQQQNDQFSIANPSNELDQKRFSNSVPKCSNYDIWLSLKDLREGIENQFDKLTLHHSMLSQLIDDRLNRLDEVHKEMHALQYKIQELATSLQVAEILKSGWLPLDNLTIERLSEQLEDLKLFRERLSETESIHKEMNSIFEWMTKSDVPLSQQNLKRICELNTIWSLIQVSVEERQKLIEQAFDNQGASEQRFLNQTVSDLPQWERRVATSRVPYFVNHETNTTRWDHPKFEELLKSMACVKQYVFSAYRTALKLRMIQKRLCIDLLMLEQLKEILEHPVSRLNDEDKTDQAFSLLDQRIINNETLVGVEQVIFYLNAIYEKIKSDEKPSLDVPMSIDLTLNWLLNLYDSTRTGYISLLSMKVGLALICCATREEKYLFMYELVADKKTGNADARKLGTLFETCMRVPTYLGEGDSFGGTEIIQTSIRNCFTMSKFNPRQPNSIDKTDYLIWLKSEPQFIIWLPVLHRLLVSEHTAHQVKCKLCRANPIIGLRYRCLKCLKFNVCQNCFLTGRHIYEHFDPVEHPLQEYCCISSSGENVRDFTKILRNKLRSKQTMSLES